ncbi:DUF177 domain-containing protein [Brevundimonas sp. NIBR11]|uniref:YceD family protein n=1 Tax=Brevundimonas sp. NIBR11 TaxID=3015999 RepID=UPI0022F0F298|nr:DUF177 domain-containing protein [Brevundimonas sp. NIBR11]WGM31063.1 hypothetical protein KKHFBJBL_01299 [Brevundimonas sp. NIBR11]
MTSEARPPFSEIVRINEIGAGIERHLIPDADAIKRIVQALDLASLSAFEADIRVAPAHVGWTLSGRVVAALEQVCGITLEPLPVQVDEWFSIDLVDTGEPETGTAEAELTLDDETPDVIEDGRIDLGAYAVEQLSLQLDPFPRKPGAEFVQPEEPAEISPFAVLKAFKPKDGDGKS